MLDPLVLIAEDDAALGGVLARGLREEGLNCEVASSGTELLALVREAAPDALIIDIGLPDSDGRDVCQALRAQGVDAPVLFLTARDALVDRLAGFDAGGDDYLTKPFSLEELIARLRALLRRAGTRVPPRLGDVQLDPVAHALCTGSHRVPLTPTEFRILAALWARPGAAVRRRELQRAGWPAGAIVSDNTLDAYIVRLRRKLRSLPDPPSLTTVHGVGYMVE
jgi:two-component system, OmpR family, response regulator